MNLKLSIAAALAATTMAAVALPASAAIVYSLDTTNVGAFGAGPYGSVTLTQNGTGVDFKIDLASGFNFVTTGNPNSHAVFAFNATGVSAGDISNIADASGLQTFSVVQPGNDSPFGSFTFGILCATGCSNGGSNGGYVDPLTFTVANSVLTDFASTSTGGTGAYFSADVITGSATGAVGATSFMTAVPEPSSWALMLAGLGAIGLGARGRKPVAFA
jgi:hypothetical protein